MEPHDNQKPAGAPRPDREKSSKPNGQRPGQPPAILTASPTPWTLLQCLRRRLILAITLGVLLAVPAGIGAWFFAPPPKHSVRTVFRIPLPVPFLVRTGEHLPDVPSYQRAQVAMVKNRLVLASALRDPAVSNLSLVVNKIEPLAWLEKEVQVDFAGAPDMMRISLNGMETDELKVLIVAIREAYLREVVEKERRDRRERMTFLGELIQKYEEQLKLAREPQKDWEKQLGAKNLSVRARMLAFLQHQLSWNEGELLKVHAKLRQAQLDLKVAQDREKQAKDLAIPEEEITKALAQDSEILGIKSEIKNLEKQINRTYYRSALGMADPAIIRDQKQINTLKKKISEATVRLREKILKQLRERAALEVQSQVSDRQKDVRLLQSLAKTLEEEVERLRKQVVDLSDKDAKLEEFVDDVSHLEAMLKRFKAELEALRVELQAPSQVTILEEATITLVNVQARKLMMTAGAAFGAFGLVLFGLSWLEYRARRVGTVDEVVLGLGMRLVGTVPNVRKTKQATATSQKDPDIGKQMLADSVDAARTMLLHLVRTHSLKTVMVSSAVASEGKTSLSCHLALSLARAGLRTLLIDADTRNPTIHKLFGLAQQPGFSDVLCEKTDPGSTIQPTAVRDLCVMPAGTWSEQMALGLNQGRARDILDYLREKCDIVVIDSSPVLPVADALVIGQQVDGVIMSVLCQVSRLNNLYAASRRLEELGIPMLGVVVSGIQESLYGATSNYPYPRKAKVEV